MASKVSFLAPSRGPAYTGGSLLFFFFFFFFFTTTTAGDSDSVVGVTEGLFSATGWALDDEDERCRGRCWMEDGTFSEKRHVEENEFVRYCFHGR